jgi:hypothetical protein
LNLKPADVSGGLVGEHTLLLYGAIASMVR